MTTLLMEGDKGESMGKRKTIEESKNRIKTTKQIVIDAGLHELLKIKAAKSRMSIKTLLEGYLADLLAKENENAV